MEMGVYLAQQKKFDPALQYLNKALGLDPTGRVAISTYNNLGNVMVRKGRLETAIACYKKVLALDPGHEHARQNLESVIKFMKKKNEGG